MVISASGETVVPGERGGRPSNVCLPSDLSTAEGYDRLS